MRFMGWVVLAIVVLAAGAMTTEDELLAHARARLAAHEVPAAVRLVGDLPRNAVGKLLRDRLADVAGAGGAVPRRSGRA